MSVVAIYYLSQPPNRTVANWHCKVDMQCFTTRQRWRKGTASNTAGAELFKTELCVLMAR